MSGKALLEVRHLKKNFGGVAAAADVNLSLYSGEIVTIIGPNGCGKSTFLNLCTGYIAPSSGEILFEDRPIGGLSPRLIARRGIGRAFQLPQLFTEHSVIENVMLALAAKQGFWRPMAPLRSAARRTEALLLLEVLGIEAIADRAIASLPEGTRKLVDIALGLAQEPRMIFLDEPTSGVSSQEKFAIMDTLCATLRKLNVTAVLVEHDMDLVLRYADRVVAWEAGRVRADGKPFDVLAELGELPSTHGRLP